jgi:carbon monoxide dehydrogenase subunit G
MNAATVTNASAYAISQKAQVTTSKTVLNKVLNTKPKTVTLNYVRSIASVTYNAGNFTSTITLAQPEPLITGSWTIQVKGTGAFAVRNATGQKLNASKPNGAGSTFTYVAAVQVGTFTHNFGGGTIGTLALTGPGTMAVITLGNLPPIVYLLDCDPLTSKLVGTLTGKPLKVKPFAIGSIVDVPTAMFSPCNGFVVAG